MIFYFIALMIIAYSQSNPDSIMMTCLESEQLDFDCNDMVETDKMHLALRLTKCHYRASNKQFIGCPNPLTPSCLSELNDEEWYSSKIITGILTHNSTFM